tara:strand:+ start:225 stop:410 length:186 start_codon:yes stop_codon:yes gene_type:complete
VLTVYRSLLLLGVFLLVREVKEEPKKRKVRKMLQIGLFFILFWPILHRLPLESKEEFLNRR